MTAVTFIIPVRHQDNAKDWSALKSNLSQTIASISAQTDKSWRAIIVANQGADLPELPPGFEVLRVDFPPNRHHDQQDLDIETFRDAFRIDKGRRVLAGMLYARDTQYYMICDDDDFVSNRIVEFAANNNSNNGWHLKYGYVWDGGSFLFLHENFSELCGTSLIVRRDLYDLPENFESASPEYIKNMLGSHVRIGKILAEKGTPLAPLPFCGAIYRVGHVGAHSKSNSIFRTFIFNRHNMLRPHVALKNLMFIRIFNSDIKKYYFGDK